MQRKRKLYLTIYNYQNEPVCNLYDNQADVTGQAANVCIQTERNGWKELSFDIPSTCMSDEGEIENYRLNYLIAEYKIKSVDDKGEDWFIISEPKIQRSNFSKNVSVTAGHISQLLRHKNLDLEFSDEEGNNVGKAEDILATILDGTDWSVGHVGEQNAQGVWHTFLEDDNHTAKQRSITAEAGTGALGLIEKLCDTFEAKPVYYVNDEGKKVVDIIPMNPFAKIRQEEIPALLRDKDLEVLELHYNRNMHDLNKTTNTDNMATRLYAYGSSGDMNGICTLQNAVHHEWNFIVEELADEYRFDIGNSHFYFTGDVSIGDELVWSDMDITSQSYIYNETKEYAYKVYKEPVTGSYLLLPSSNPSDVLNQFAYLLGLKYYDDVGLMTEEQFQEVAKFQRTMPEYYTIIQENSEQFIKGEAELSKLAEHATGLLRLEIDHSAADSRFYISTQEGDHGVLYRSDYEKAERRYFQWHITNKLDNNGQPVTGIPSVLFIVHNTDPITYDMTYLKCIWDTQGMVIDEDGNPKDFEYSTGNYPVSFSVWGDYTKHDGDRFYLFCTDSMQGMLGSRLSNIEAVYQDLYNATMKHPVTFFDADSNLVPPSPTGAEYEWRYDYHNVIDGELYFCWKDKFAEQTWQRVYISDTFPEATSGYYYDTRHKYLYRYDSEWVRIEDKQITTKMFETVIYYCKRRDELYRGIYEYYFYNYPLEVGNYAIHDGYNAYWMFKIKEPVENNILLDYIKGYIFSDVEFDEDDEPVISGTVTATPQSVEARSVTYPTDNELAERTFYPGTISSNGIDEKTEFSRYKTNYIPVSSSEEYFYFLPLGSDIFLYNENNVFISSVNTGEVLTGSFNTTLATKYIRVVVDEITGIDGSVNTNYIKENQSDTNLLQDRPFIDGSIDSEGHDLNVNRYRTYTIPAYENTSYEYYLPPYSSVYFYDINLHFIDYAPLSHDSSTGTYTTPPNTAMVRFVSSTNDLSGYYVRIVDYDKKIYMNREAYYILDNIITKGELIGITPLTKRFTDTADEIYMTYLAELRNAQDEAKDKEKNLAVLLGDMLKDGRWQDANYIKGDEKRLYDDALYMLKQVSMPEVSYSFNYLDMYCVKNEHFFEEHDIEWPDINIMQTAHLVDTESKTNCWAYIDKINKCYDQPWKTIVDIDTKLTLASRHGFSDVIARIAEISKEIKAKQALYDQASTGKISGSRLEGVIDLNQVYLNGGSSNWYNDEKGNLIFESADGLSAMMLGGRGLGIATERADDGSWMWRTAATGYGMAADTITTGYLSADRIEAGVITLDKLSSNVGKELEISSNTALLLYATEDGSRPAGSLKTTDGLIEIIAGKENRPAKINIVSGGELNLNGGKVSVYSQGEMDVSSGGKFTLKSQDATSMSSTGPGLFIDSEEGINFAGGKLKVETHGDTMDVRIKADVIELGQTGDAALTMDAASKTISVDALNAININSGNTITIAANKTLSLLTNGTIEIGKTGHLFTIGGDNNRSYIFHGMSGTTDTSSGVYVGTDGFALKQGNTKFLASNGEIALSTGSSAGDYVSMGVNGTYRIWAGDPTPANAPFSVQKDGTIYASKGTIGIFDLDDEKIAGGSGTNHIELNVNVDEITPSVLQFPYAIWSGANLGADAPFSVKKDGTLFSKQGTIGGFTINEKKLHAGSGSTYIELNSDSSKTGNNYNQPYALWIGDETASLAPFKVDREGNATMSGTIESSSGHIAGWTIDSSSIKWITNTTTGVAAVGLAKQTGTIQSGNPAIWAGGSSTNGSNAPFKVFYDGTMSATGATLTSATISNASISNGTINSATITGGSFTILNGNNILFKVDAYGKMFLRPNTNDPNAGGWYFDANDIAGPWLGNTSQKEENNTGRVQINCNPNPAAKTDPRISVGTRIGEKESQFYVTGEGHIYCNYIHCRSGVYIAGDVACASVNGRVI